jgi:hypothetical protein
MPWQSAFATTLNTVNKKGAGINPTPFSKKLEND